MRACLLVRLAGCFLFVVTLAAHAAPVAITPANFPDAAQPQVAVAPSGIIHVVFGKDTAIYHTTSPDGRSFSPPVKVGQLHKLALRMRRGPRISATDSSIVITAISHADGDLHAWISTDQGATWKEGARLNEPAHSAREGLHAMAGDGHGLVAVAWLDLRNHGTELWSRVSRDGGANWMPEVRIYASPDGHICQCCHPSLAIGPRGEITAMWRNSIGNSRDLWMAGSRDNGQHFDPAQKLGSGTWNLNACPMDGGAIAIDSAGAPMSVWRREKSVFLITGTDAEQKLADNAAQPVIAIARGEPVVVWEESGGLKIQTGHTSPHSLAANAKSPSVAALPGNAVIAVWESTSSGVPSLQSEIVQP